MSTHRAYFSDAFDSDTIGVITGSATVTQFPAILGSAIRFQTPSSNYSNFYIGTSNVAGLVRWEMVPGDDLGWFAGKSLDRFYFYSTSGTKDYLVYWIQK